MPRPRDDDIMVTDVYQVAYMYLKGAKFSTEQRGSLVIFRFPPTISHRAMSNEFMRNAEVPVMDFANAIKIVRNIMYSNKKPNHKERKNEDE
jgi:hypothetical protein